MTQYPKILLISATQPSARGVGGLYLLDCCRVYPPDRIACLHFVPSHENKPWVPELALIRHNVHSWPEPRLRRTGPGKIGSLTSFLDRQFIRWWRQSALLTKSLQFARQFQPDTIWTVLESPLMYELPRQLAEKLNRPLICTVWDPPETVCGPLGYDRWSFRQAVREFEETVRFAKRLSVVSENMASDYANRYGADSIVMRHAVHREQCRTRPAREPDGTFRIGFAGSIYAKSEWDALMFALDSVHWRIGSRDVEVWVFGQRLLLQATGRNRVRFFGWCGTEELLSTLSQVDVAYLPYWFDIDRRESVRHCFPTKLGTYLACGLPLLFHGPTEASVATFLKKYPAGVVCDSNEASRIVACLKRLAEDIELQSSMQQAREYILQHVLNLGLFQEQFGKFVDLSSTASYPPVVGLAASSPVG